MDDSIYPCGVYFATENSENIASNFSDEEEPSDYRLEFLQSLNKAMNGWLTLIVVVVGMVTNTLTLIIFCSEAKKASVYTHLVFLTVWDILLLVPSALFMYCIPTLLTGHSTAMTGWFAFTTKYAFYMCKSCMVGVTWVILCTAVFRYFAICHPMIYKYRVGQRTGLRAQSLISITALIYTLPDLFYFQVLHCYTPTGEKESFIYPSSWAFSAEYQLVYRVICGIVFHTVVPMVFLVYLTSRVAYTMSSSATLQLRLQMLTLASIGDGAHTSGLATDRKATMVIRMEDAPNPASRTTRASQSSMASLRVTNNGEDSSNGQQANKTVNRVFLVVFTKFIISRTLSVLLDVASAADFKSFMISSMVVLFVNLNNLVVNMNSASNFWVYLAYSPRFRHRLRSMFGLDLHDENESLVQRNASVSTHAHRLSNRLIRHHTSLTTNTNHNQSMVHHQLSSKSMIVPSTALSKSRHRRLSSEAKKITYV